MPKVLCRHDHHQIAGKIELLRYSFGGDLLIVATVDHDRAKGHERVVGGRDGPINSRSSMPTRQDFLLAFSRLDLTR